MEKEIKLYKMYNDYTEEELKRLPEIPNKEKYGTWKRVTFMWTELGWEYVELD